MTTIIITILNIFAGLFILRALLSYFPNIHRFYFVQLLFLLTEPFLKRIRKILPNTGMFDLSVLAAILIIQILKAVIYSLI
jgi:YggT family protein